MLQQVNSRLPTLQEVQQDTAQTNQLTNISKLEQEVLRLISQGSEYFALQLFKVSLKIFNLYAKLIILMHLIITFQSVLQENSAQNYNFIMSPFSVWSLIVLLVEGAGGKTLKEIESVLGLPDNIAYVRHGYQQIRTALK